MGVRNETITSPQVAPSIIESINEVSGGRWRVTVYNNEVNTYEEVIMILMLATECDYDEAYSETWEIDNIGQSVVHRSGEQECRKVADIISKIGIRVDVDEEED